MAEAADTVFEHTYDGPFPSGIRLTVTGNGLKMTVRSNAVRVVRNTEFGPQEHFEPGPLAEITLPASVVFEMLPALRRSIITLTDKR
jgi:hypothetical protein